MVALRIMAKNEEEAKQKLIKQMRSSDSFDKVHLAYPSFEDGGFMNNVYAKGGNANRFVIVEGFDSFKNRPLYQVVDKSEQGEYVGEYHTNRKDAEEELKDLQNSFADGGFMNDVYAKGGELADIQKMKKALISKAKSRGLYEKISALVLFF
jgi:hypothetical protein